MYIYIYIYIYIYSNERRQAERRAMSARDVEFDFDGACG